jgi:hypothetical protein
MQLVLLASRFVNGEKYIRGAICNEELDLRTSCHNGSTSVATLIVAIFMFNSVIYLCCIRVLVCWIIVGPACDLQRKSILSATLSAFAQ